MAMLRSLLRLRSGSRRGIGGLSVVLSVLVLASSCGGSSSSASSNGESTKPPDQILKDAQNATASAKSVHVAGSGQQSGTTLRLDIVAAQATGGGTVDDSGALLDVILAGNKIYLKGDAQSWQTVTKNPALAQLFAGKWLSTSSSNPDFADVVSLVDISKLPQQITPQGTVSVGKVTSRNGVSVIPLNDSAGGTLYVAAKGPPYMIQVVGASDNPGTLNFGQYGTAQPPPAPTGALDLDQLKNSGS